MNNLKNKLNILWRIIYTLPSRIIFGNCIEIKKNIIPLFQFFFFKKLFIKKTELEREGFVNIKYNLNKDIIEDTKNHFNTLIEDSKNLYSESGKQKLIKNPLNIKNLKKLTEVFDKNLKDYYDGNYKFINIFAWRNYHDESKDSNWEKYIYSNYWHYDQYRTDILKIFILLNDDTNENAGSTKITNIKTSNMLSRSFKFIDTSLSNKKLEDYLIKKNLVHFCNGDMGDVYIINTSKCLHSASIPKINCVRDLIQLETIKSYKNEDPFADLHRKFN